MIDTMDPIDRLNMRVDELNREIDRQGRIILSLNERHAADDARIRQLEKQRDDLLEGVKLSYLRFQQAGIEDLFLKRLIHEAEPMTAMHTGG